MQTQTVLQKEIPNYVAKLMMGMLLVSLTLLFLFTAVAPLFNALFVDEACQAAALSSEELFSMTTAVPNCWLIS